MTMLNKQQVDTILKNAPAGVDKTKILDGLINRGYEIEGVDTNMAKMDIARRTGVAPAEAPQKTFGQKVVDFGKETIDDFKQVGKEVMTSAQKSADIIAPTDQPMKPKYGFDPSATLTPNKKEHTVDHLFQAVGALASAGADTIGAAFKGALKIVLPQEAEDKIKELAAKGITNAMSGQYDGGVIKSVTEKAQQLYNNLNENQKKNVDAAGGIANLVSQFIGGEAVNKGVTTGIDTAKDVATTVAKNAKSLTEPIIQNTDTILSKGRNFVDRFTAPDVSEAAKVSLNPEKALKGTTQDVLVSVKSPVAGEKPILKNLSELTPEEKKMVQVDTAKTLDDFTKQAEIFKRDRSVADGSPVEIVGKRVDTALELADKERQKIGSQMGEIEKKYLDNKLDIGEDTMKVLDETMAKFKNPRFGMDTGGAPVVQKLTEDFAMLQTNGATIQERLQFVRDWQDYLRNSKDGFGNFKDNAVANARVEKVINGLRNETVDHISQVDSEYKNLRTEYAKHIQLQDIGDSLLGKDGALGERVKGAATVKRAIQSNSDAGARQFLTRLKEITGYDAIKEGDIALTAMDDVGDYQGLSLLNVLNEGKSGVVKKILEKGQDLLVGDKAARAKRYINAGEDVGSQAPKGSMQSRSVKKSYDLSIPQDKKIAIDKLTAAVKTNIVEIIDDFRLKGGKSLTLQEDAAKIAEDLGIPMPKTYGALVNKLEKILQANDSKSIAK